VSLRILDAAPRRGLAWVSQAFSLFLKRPLGFSLLLLFPLAAAPVLFLLPFVGPFLVLFVGPLLTLGFATAARAALAGDNVHLGQLVEPLLPGGDKKRRRSLLALCLVYVAGAVLLLVLAQVLDGSSLEHLPAATPGQSSEATQRQVVELLNDPRFQNAVRLRLSLLALLSVPFWHAPMLIWWHGQGVAQAIFSSTLAWWRNKGAFTIYLVAWAGTMLLFGVACGLLFALLGAPQMATIAAAPAVLLFSTAFYVSLYFTFADCFGESGDGATTLM
jgi:transposase